MNPWTLTSTALSEPWRLWTCHLAHHGLEHLAGNALALALPFLIARRGTRLPLARTLLILAPLLSLALLPFLGDAAHGGASALAAAAWAILGVRFAADDETCLLGLAILLLLALKLSVEGLTASGIIAHDGRWQSLSAAHLLGALAGLTVEAIGQRPRRKPALA